MWKNRFSLWITGPTILVSLVLLILCTVVAVFLYMQPDATRLDLEENVDSTLVAHDLINTLSDLAYLLANGQEQVEPLHERIRGLLKQARGLADKFEEQKHVGELEVCLDRYFHLWEKRSYQLPEARAATVARCEKILETEALPRCRELQAFNALQIRRSENTHRATVNWAITGLLSVGVVGAVAGLLLGYGVARRLRHSIYHLRVRVQDAASKLGQDLPAVDLEEDGDLHQIQQQMQSVIGDIEQVVQKLQQREREVLRAEQLAALGQLAAGVAHEIRNPLTSIKLLVQTLREEFEARGTPAEDLQVMELEIRRMERCLQTFLDYARPPQLDCKPLDLAVPISQTFALIAGRASKQGVALEFTPTTTPLLVTADAEQLQQLLVNLTLNALDAMPRGGKLRIDLRELSGGQVELTVRDTGPGIVSKLLPTLFLPFVSTKETGLGLGLVTSRRIAETHGGTLHAANLPAGGACFTLRLPMLMDMPKQSKSQIPIAQIPNKSQAQKTNDQNGIQLDPNLDAAHHALGL
jgi:two-component system, NtrC family, sensor histidine kinase HydH